MNSVIKLGRLFFRHPLALSTVPFVAFRNGTDHLFRRDTKDGFSGEDPEVALYELRGNWVLRALQEDKPETRIERFKDAMRRAASCPPDAYSSAQRLANAIYLLRALPEDMRRENAAAFAPALAKDAAYLREHPEFRSFPMRFNNHLLNGYRAAVLAEMHRPILPALPDLAPFMSLAGKLLERHRAMLFGDDGILLEGSVSYELLGLKHVIDIACSAATGPFAERLRDWARFAVVERARFYRKDEMWLLPQIGDSSPDWDVDTIRIFLDGLVLRHDTPYRRIWRSELLALGL